MSERNYFPKGFFNPRNLYFLSEFFLYMLVQVCREADPMEYERDLLREEGREAGEKGSD